MHARIQEFSSGGGGGGRLSSDNLFFNFFLVLSLVNFKEIHHFFKVAEGVQHFPRGVVQLFPEGGGSNCLFPVEIHITCDIPWGSGPPVPPLDPHVQCLRQSSKPPPLD